MLFESAPHPGQRRSRPGRRPVSRSTGALVLAGALLALLLVGWQRWDARVDQLSAAREATAQLARALAQHTRDSLDKAAVSLDAIALWWEIDGAAAPARLPTLLAGHLGATPQLRELLLIDAGGRQLAAARPPGERGDNHAAREYFQFHRDHAGLGPRVGAPRQERDGGAWSVPLSRRLNRADGSFGGVALVWIRLVHLQHLYAQADTGGQGVVTLVSDTGVVLARHPYVPEMIGQTIGDATLARDYLSGHARGNVRHASPMDGVARVYGFQALGGYPLMVAVGRGEQDALDTWTAETINYVAAVLAALLALGLLAIRLIRKLDARERTWRMLGQISDSLPMLVCYTDTALRLRYANQACEEWTGRALDQLLGQELADILGRDTYAVAEPTLRAALKGQPSVTQYRSSVFGKVRDLRVQHMPQIGARGQVQGLVTVVSDISEYRDIQQALRRSQKSLQQAQALAHVGSWEYDIDSGKMSWSAETYQIHGHEPGSVELSWDKVVGMVHPQDRARMVATYHDAIDNGTGFIVNLRLVRPDGSVRHVVDTAALVQDNHRRRARLVGALVDVTRYKEIEERIVASERMLRSVADSLPILVGYIRMDETYAFNNHAFEKLTGTPLAQITGRPVSEVSSAQYHAICAPHIQIAMQGEKSSVEFVFVTDQGPRNLRAEFLPQFDERGATQGVVSVTTDITEFRHIQDRLQTSGQILRNAQKIAHLGSWEYDMASAQIVWSDETYRIFGLAPHEVARLDFEFVRELIHVDDRAEVTRVFGRELAAAGRYEIEYRIVRPDGELRYLADRAESVVDEAGMLKLIGAIIDITERKLAELAIRAASLRELAIGYDIQQSLLMSDVPSELNGAWVTSFVEASQGLHGDFVAVSQHSPTRFNLLVGDVMGKGIHAAMIGAGVKNMYYQVLAELMSCAIETRDMPGAATIVNALHRRVTPKLIAMDSFVTLALYEFNVAAGTVAVVNAGHTPGFLMRADGRLAERIDGCNLPIGVLASEAYQQRVVHIGYGDQLVVYSDGISEIGNAAGDEFGADGIAAWLAQSKAAGLPDAAALQLLRQQLASFGSRQRIIDDQTVMMIRLRPVRQLPRKSVADRRSPIYLTLPFRADGVELLREHIAQASAHWARADADELLLAVTQAAASVIGEIPATLPNSSLACCFTASADAMEVEFYYHAAAGGGHDLRLMRELLDEVEFSAPAEHMVRLRLRRRMAPRAAPGPVISAQAEIEEVRAT